MKKSNVFIALGLVLVIAAALLVGYNCFDAYRAGKSSAQVLESLLRDIDEPAPDVKEQARDRAPDEMEYPDYMLNPSMDLPVKIINGRAYVGVIQIPKLEIELPVLQEWSNANLRISPCLYTGTPYLENLVICAHNYRSHFGRLNTLSLGDEIIFTDTDGNEFTYAVAEIETLRPTDTAYMIAAEWPLTLFTCTPGGATRVTVRCAAKS